MNWKSVSSSNLSEVGYDATTSTLYVRFHNSGAYAYSNVPESIYNGLMAAASHGSYFDTNVKKAGFSYRKI
ncbi:KTSC domain-containing protein [Paenibacillus wenxiniae]|uniref:KTSC domain-containing protein n=1 Tax=Paenibacillus wenxiniae TaxID=1636843 RepID=A0ABW4RI10_9BACL